MSTASIQRQYNEVIASRYDRDPLSVTNDTLQRALRQLAGSGVLGDGLPAARVLDVGMGTGLFFELLARETDREFLPFGLDLSQSMIDIASRRVPELVAEVDDAANLDRHFIGETFDIVCTHFITGFVPLADLAPLIWQKLKPGGVWSFVGATSAAYPNLQRIASSRLIRTLFRSGDFSLADLKTPRSQQHVEEELSATGFEIAAAEDFQPDLRFANFAKFMEFAYDGGWLTPFIEDLGLQHASRWTRAALNLVVFPIQDNHNIALVLGRKPLDSDSIADDPQPGMASGPLG